MSSVKSKKSADINEIHKIETNICQDASKTHFISVVVLFQEILTSH